MLSHLMCVSGPVLALARMGGGTVGPVSHEGVIGSWLVFTSLVVETVSLDTLDVCRLSLARASGNSPVLVAGQRHSLWAALPFLKQQSGASQHLSLSAVHRSTAGRDKGHTQWPSTRGWGTLSRVRAHKPLRSQRLASHVLTRDLSSGAGC